MSRAALFRAIQPDRKAALIESAHELSSDISAAADEIEEMRRIPAGLVKRFLETGIWRMGYPPQVDLLTRFEVIEIISGADGSAGWCTMLAGGGGGCLPGVDTGSLHELVDDKYAIVAGAVRPAGRAVHCEGGFRVSGRWPFVSGCNHATWIAGGCIVHDDGVPRLDSAGRPVLIFCYVPRSDIEIVDTWRTTGLRGTGSDDVVIDDVFVPAGRAFSPVPATPPSEIDPFLAVPGLSLLYHAPVVLGIARSALRKVIELTKNKVSARGSPVAREAQVQAEIAHAEALVGSARSYVIEVLSDICAVLERGERPSPHQRALCRLSISHAHRNCVEAVNRLYEIGSGASPYAKNGMDRLLRDMRTANQHIVADYKTFEVSGRMLLGMSPGEPMF